LLNVVLFALFELYLWLCIFLYCFVCQASDWLWRPPPKSPRFCRLGR